MNSEIERLFASAVEMPRHSQAAYLLRNCTDAAIRSHVEQLLAFDEGAEDFVANTVTEAAKSALENLSCKPGQRFGAFRIVSLLGGGGMGFVYLAERADNLFDQRVAIKIVYGGPDRPSLQQRIRQEYQILGRLEHPNIARLLEAGATNEGLPYFAMEYVEGCPIDRYCDERNLSVRDRLELMLPVCDAVQFAHQKLVVHRDLKPANIFVTDHGLPKLLDFGIAKILNESSPPDQPATRLLTLEYGSPEQIRGELAGTPMDVYSLGGVLYKLLTGMPPHQLDSTNVIDAMREICEGDVRPPKELRPSLERDAGHIVQMALRKDPERRYRSVEQLAEDIHRFLEGRPVLASPDSAWYRSHKFVRRHWSAVTAVAAMVLILTTATGIATWQDRRAERRFNDVRQLANIFLFDFEQSIHDVPGATTARQLLVTTALRYLRSLSEEASGDPTLTRELATAWEKVGDIQGGGGYNVGKTLESVDSYKQAIALRRGLHDQQSREPATLLAFSALLTKIATAQARRNEIDPAIRNCGEAVREDEGALLEAPNGPAKDQLAAALSQMAFLLLRKNDSHASLKSAERALELRRGLAAEQPGNRRRERKLADAWWTMGDLSEQMGLEKTLVIGYYQSALGMYVQLCLEDPTDADAKRWKMIVLAELGRMQSFTASKISQREGLRNLEAAYALANLNVTADPANAEAVSDLVAIATRLGDSLSAQGRLAGARELLERSVRAATDLVRRDPGSGEDRLNLALAQARLSDAIAKGGDLEGSIARRREAEAIYSQISVQSPEDSKILLARVWNWLKLGGLLASKHDWAGAQRMYDLGLRGATRTSNPAFAEVLTKLRSARAQAISAATQN